MRKHRSRVGRGGDRKQANRAGRGEVLQKVKAGITGISVVNMKGNELAGGR